MNRPGHEFVAVALTAGAGFAAGLPTLAVAAVAAGAYKCAMLPDLDMRLPLVPHRGALTHGVFTTLPVTLLAALVAVVYAPPIGDAAAAAVASGIVTHLAADACTLMGLSGWPFTRRVWILPRRLRFASGGKHAAARRRHRRRFAIAAARRRGRR